MTGAEVVRRARAIAEKISLKGGVLLEPCISVGHDWDPSTSLGPGRLSLRISYLAGDRESGERTRIHMVNAVDIDHAVAIAEAKDENLDLFIAGNLYDLIRDAHAHECDEAFTINGVRVFDPHDSKRDRGTFSDAIRAAVAG